jgi:hypothetical protein
VTLVDLAAATAANALIGVAATTAARAALASIAHCANTSPLVICRSGNRR